MKKGKRYRHGWAYWLSALGYLALAGVWLFAERHVNATAGYFCLVVAAAMVFCAIREILFFFRDTFGKKKEDR